MFCKNCGSYNPDSAERCASCGENISQLAQDPAFPTEDLTTETVPAEKPGKGLGITSLIMGILSICCVCIPYLPVFPGALGFLFGIIAVIKAKKAQAKSVTGIIGVILSCVGVAVFVLEIVAIIFGVALSSTYG